MGKYFFVFSFGFLFILGCQRTDKVEKEIAQIDTNMQISRFDREFAKAKPEDIPRLKQKYPYLFPSQYADSVWVAKIKDTIQIELSAEAENQFGNLGEESSKLDLLFKHILYYFPDYEIPKVVTLASDVDYNNKIVLADTLLLINLDNYLGKEHKFYSGIQNYIASGLDKRFMISDVVSAFAQKVVPLPHNRNFLSQIIYYGKILYLKDKLIPQDTDAQKIGYEPDQLAWAQANEEQIWRYFIERELLYSTDQKLRQRFLDPAPFTKFGLELDNESPGGLGRYMGWQIVRSFMKNNDVSLQQMLSLPADEIFKKSNYKPKK
ncbi:gliding motility lipoprotein GldB [Cerina litoralis]